MAAIRISKPSTRCRPNWPASVRSGRIKTAVCMGAHEKRRYATAFQSRPKNADKAEPKSAAECPNERPHCHAEHIWVLDGHQSATISNVNSDSTSGTLEMFRIRSENPNGTMYQLLLIFCTLTMLAWNMSVKKGCSSSGVVWIERKC